MSESSPSTAGQLCLQHLGRTISLQIDRHGRLVQIRGRLFAIQGTAAHLRSPMGVTLLITGCPGWRSDEPIELIGSHPVTVEQPVEAGRR